MSDPLGAIPAELRTVADHLTEVSSRVKEVFTRLNSQLAGEGAPWGDDSSGDEFAKGPQGYLAQLDWVNGAIAAKTQLLEGYSQSMNSSATAFEKHDEQPDLPGSGAATSPALPREVLQRVGPGRQGSGVSPALPRHAELPVGSVHPDQVLAASGDSPALPREVDEIATNSVQSDELPDEPLASPETPLGTAFSATPVFDLVTQAVEDLASPVSEGIGAVIGAIQSDGQADQHGKVPGFLGDSEASGNGS